MSWRPNRNGVARQSSAGKYKEAISIYQELVKALPAEPGLRLNLGIAHYMAGQYRRLDPAPRGGRKSKSGDDAGVSVSRGK